MMKMKLWVTEIRAIDPKDGELKTYCGEIVPGDTQESAQQYCDDNELGYCKVLGQLVDDDWAEDPWIRITELLKQYSQ